jgi:hypothetical protein
MTRTTVTDEAGWEIIRAFTTEQPQPSQQKLAARFKLSRAAIQRYLAKNLTTAQQTEQPSREAVRAEIMVKEYPAALREVGITVSEAHKLLVEILKDLEARRPDFEGKSDDLARWFKLKLSAMENFAKMAGAYAAENVTAIQVNAQGAPPQGPPPDLKSARCSNCPHNGPLDERIAKYAEHFRQIDEKGNSGAQKHEQELAMKG